MFKKMNKKPILSMILLSLVLFLTVSFLGVRASATREVTLTTYYPAPYGNYVDLYATDKVGIGTTTPDKTLTVKGNMRLYSEGAYNGGLVYGFNPSNNIASFTFRDKTDMSYNDVYMEANSWRFFYGGNANTALFIKNDGNTGIGTTSPRKKLHVQGGELLVSNGPYGGTLRLTDGNENDATSVILQNTGNGCLYIASPSGMSRVGIGVGAPQSALQVNGSLKVGTGSSGNAPVTFYSTAGDNFNIMTYTNSPNPNFAIGIGNGVGGWANIPIFWNGFLALQKDGGNVGVGTTSPNSKLHIANTNSESNGLLVTNGSGTIDTDYATLVGPRWIKMRDGPFQPVYLTSFWGNWFMSTPSGNIYLGVDQNGSRAGTVYYNNIAQYSDIRLKKNVSTINKALDKVLKMRGVIFEWKNKKLEGMHYGVIAQEIEKVLPETVKTDFKGEKSVAYTEIVPVLIEAIKEQQKEIEALKSGQKQLSELKARNKLLEQRIEALEKAIKAKK